MDPSTLDSPTAGDREDVLERSVIRRWTRKPNSSLMFLTTTRHGSGHCMTFWPTLRVYPLVTTDRPGLEIWLTPVHRLWDQPVGWGDSNLVCPAHLEPGKQ